MAKDSKKAGKKVEKVMREKKKGTLKSGSGKKVTSRKQAIAIGLSEARKAGAKVPKKKSNKIVKTSLIALGSLAAIGGIVYTASKRGLPLPSIRSGRLSFS